MSHHLSRQLLSVLRLSITPSHIGSFTDQKMTLEGVRKRQGKDSESVKQRFMD